MVVTLDVVLTVVLGLAGIGSAVLLGLGLAALVRRRSRLYLLVALALATLLVRTLVAALTVAGTVPVAEHHLVEHALDVVMAGLVIAAVIRVRATDARADAGAQSAEGRPGLDRETLRGNARSNDAPTGDEHLE